MAPRNIVYGLIDPRDGLLRYVGKSSNGLSRPRFHTSPGAVRRERHFGKGRWIWELVQLALKPEIVVLEEADTKEALPDLEIFWIASLRAAGADLLNMTPGGDGCAFMTRTPEWIEKIASAQRGVPRPYAARPRTEEVKARISATQAGVPRATAGANHGCFDPNVDTERDILAPIRAGQSANDVAAALGKGHTFVHRRLKAAGTSVRAIRRGKV